MSSAITPSEAPDTDPGAPDGTHRPPRRRRRRGLIALIVVAALVLGVAAVVGGYLYSLQHSLYSKSSQIPLATSTLAHGGGENYLLLGSDKRDPEEASAAKVYGQRSDVMMLVHVAADHKSAYVISFPRDLYIDIPGHGKNRINAALAQGGVPLAVSAVSAYTGVPIDHAALIDFEGIQGLVDELGGVEVRVDRTFDADGIHFSSGLQKMDGRTALVYVRQRKQLPDGDFGRNRHQQALLAALADKIISADTLSNPLKIKSLVDTAAPYLTIDDGLTPSRLVSLGLGLRDLRSSDISYLSVPHGGPTTTSGGASVVATDEKGMAALRTALKNDDMATYYSAHAG